MSDTTISSLIHGAEAIVVLLVALFLAHFFPEYRDQALVVAVGVLSTLVKEARGSDAIPVPDYVNPPKTN